MYVCIVCIPTQERGNEKMVSVCMHCMHSHAGAWERENGQCNVCIVCIPTQERGNEKTVSVGDMVLPEQSPRRRFGQHFLTDTVIVEKIIRAIDPQPGERIVEIGPGRGALTLPLLLSVGTLDVVEIDRDLAAQLLGRCRGLGRLNLVQQDALKVDFAALAELATGGTPGRLKVVGNLPYNISTPLLFHLLSFNQVGQMLFMLQKEVVERICADSGAPEYGRLSVMVQARCHTEQLFDVEPAAFTPRPKVNSAVLRLTARADAASRIKDCERFATLVRDAFSARRKKLSNALKAWFDAAQLEQLQVSPDARPADLSVEDYIRLSNS